MSTRKLLPDDAPALIALRTEALAREPLSFAASPGDDVASSADAVRRFLTQAESQAVFGWFEGSILIGMVGLVRGTKEKQRHRANLWGMYVRPNARRKGVGRALLGAVIEQGREWGVDQLLIGVTDAALSARRLYEAAGFQVWGREPRALKWESRFVDEDHMVLNLSASEPKNVLQPREDARV